MILGIGVDISNNMRFSSLSKGLEEKVYTSSELKLADSAPSRAQFLSSRFAAKEAFVKAYGTGFGPVEAKDIEIYTSDNGKPEIRILKKLERSMKIHLSISHEREFSVAMVVIEDVSC